MTATELSARDKAVLNCVFNPNLPLDEAVVQLPEELKDEEESNEIVRESGRLELEAIENTEMGNLEEGLKLIDAAIEISGNRPSLYNNRAYIFQFLRKFNDAFNDVNKSIALCTEKHKKTLCQAYCQRGLLHRRAGRIKEARADFEEATKMGNQFAKGQLVELNPYAALCNQMLKQIMETLN